MGQRRDAGETIQLLRTCFVTAEGQSLVPSSGGSRLLVTPAPGGCVLAAAGACLHVHSPTRSSLKKISLKKIFKKWRGEARREVKARDLSFLRSDRRSEPPVSPCFPFSPPQLPLPSSVCPCGILKPN